MLYRRLFLYFSLSSVRLLFCLIACFSYFRLLHPMDTGQFVPWKDILTEKADHCKTIFWINHLYHYSPKNRDPTFFSLSLTVLRERKKGGCYFILMAISRTKDTPQTAYLFFVPRGGLRKNTGVPGGGRLGFYVIPYRVYLFK